MDQKTKDIDLLLIGKTGNGKSSTGNSILNRKIFKSGTSTTSITNKVQVHFGNYNDRTIKVVDGPGVGDTDLSEEEMCKQIIGAMSLAIAASPQGYHAFLLVVRFGGRFTKEDKQTIEILKAVFGEDFVKKFTVVLVTYGDNFNSEDTDSDSFEDWCSFQTGVFRDLIVECGNRVVLFDNKTKDVDIQKRQLDRLLEIVDRLGQRYTNKHFELAQKRRDALLVDVNKPIISEESMKEASLILQKLGNISLKEPEAQLKHLDILHRRAENLLQSITKQDNNTGVLLELIQNAQHIKETVDSQVSRARIALDIQTKRRELLQEMEKLSQEKAKHAHDLEEYERRKLIKRMQSLKEKDRENREKIERMESEMRNSLSVVEKEYVEASGSSVWSAIAEVAKILLTNLLPLVLSFLGKHFFKK